MKKQEFLDKKNKTPQEIATLALLMAMNKTHLTNLEARLKQVNNALYSTEMKKISTDQLLYAVQDAIIYHNEKPTKDGINQMENS